ncbi:MAG TPA: NAD(P)H-dependent glycerol-3-phosphate dehydrogenase [Candidatus Binataceae bacterium]|nr:NAD(P)H-dependent glycerol-3-phosphate dehydrogenase [Candidatus Binataceae bacterium]
MKTQNIVVLGAGAWGTALAVMLTRSGYRVTLCARREKAAREITGARENRAHLRDVTLPAQLAVTASWTTAVADAQIVVMAIPSRFARDSMVPVASAIPRGALLVSATKGIEADSLKTMTTMLAELVPSARAYAALSGPGFAAEVARRLPVALVAASSNAEAAREVQQTFASPSMRIYTSTDPTGVELCGAAKNVIAIAAGMSDGLALGSSARAAVVTRAVAEIARLIQAAGGRRETVMGLAGLGDIVLTCTGDLSRNRSYGLAFARGERDKIELASGGVAEGVSNAKSIRELARRHRVEMPIVEAVCRTLYEGEPPQAMVDGLLSRALKSEF